MENLSKLKKQINKMICVKVQVLFALRFVPPQSIIRITQRHARNNTSIVCGARSSRLKSRVTFNELISGIMEKKITISSAGGLIRFTFELHEYNVMKFDSRPRLILTRAPLTASIPR